MRSTLTHEHVFQKYAFFFFRFGAVSYRGTEYTTMIGEHGPPAYQQCALGTKEPLANIWDVNHWIQLRRQARFEKLFCDEGQPSKLVPGATQGAELVINSWA